MSNRNMHLVTWTSYKQDFVYYNDEKLPSRNSDADFHDVILSLGNGRLLRDWIALWGDN